MNVEPWDEWVAKAEEDWTALNRLLAGELIGVANVLVFLAQQSAEKYLKALLAREGIEPPRIHNLGVLLDLATEKYPELESVRREAETLTPYAVAYRYPGVWATIEEAEEAIEYATKIRRLLRKILDLPG